MAGGEGEVSGVRFSFRLWPCENVPHFQLAKVSLRSTLRPARKRTDVGYYDEWTGAKATGNSKREND